MQYFSRSAGEQWREDLNLQPTFVAFEYGGSKLRREGAADASGLGSADDKAVRDILYNVENLRKRPGAED